ncbi:MAG: hypothetical protein OXG05_01435 [Gammaproteobacteria bacterium]|nr:hypothetical protein [Gammaproteobacteria bacterium]
MLQNDLRQLQRLGIDVWVSPERARELITAGQAKSMLDVLETPSSQSATRRQSTTQARVQRRAVETTISPTVEGAKVPIRERNEEEARNTREEPVESKTSKPFTVYLRVFLYGKAAMVADFSIPWPESLPKDILRALSGFEEHQINELHFKFPLVGLAKNESSIATLAGAQEGFQAWFDQRAPHCKSMIAIGTAVRDTTAQLKKQIPRTIYIDELPISHAGKQKLWNQIKNLNV